ncbi:MAG: single-stranded-DNA-specific exonuclease RecJ [Ottowia sp.]|nr:single-stranded-DNA-specific exonuclease RecJ [Ottowia sp.]
MKLTVRTVPPRAAWALEQAGIHPLLARLYAGRGVTRADELDPGLGKLLPPSALLGAEQAAALLADAIAQDRHLCIVADYDCDGATACAVGLRGLRLLGARQTSYLVPNRVADGYGLTPAIAERVAATGANVLITVDNGIASVAGVARAQELGLQVLVTDHHLPGLQLPAADVIVNPNQPGCSFPSKALAGVGVMFYVLLALRSELRRRGVFSREAQPRLDTLLPLVALGTVADVVPLDANNRRLVAQGLQRIRSGHMPRGLAALFAVAGRDWRRAATADFGFALGPRINAAGRLADMAVGILLLTSDDATQASELAATLDHINRQRRSVEGDMDERARELAEALFAGSSTPPPALAVFQPDFHEGVVGIVASRLKERWHRPVFVFARSGAAGQSGTLKGSGRSIPGFHLRDALDLMAKRNPDILSTFGGHAMAAGCSIAEAQWPQFQQAFAQVAGELLDAASLTRELQTDGALPARYRRVDLVQALQGEVWGQGFAPPTFSETVEVISQRLVGEHHLKLRLRHQGEEVDGIWFRRVTPLPRDAHLAFRPEVNEWRGQQSVQFVIEGQATPAAQAVRS